MGDHNMAVQDICVAGQETAHGSALRTIVSGALVAGTLDITAAIVTWLFKGVPASRVLQGVAGGLLGRDAFSGGAPTAAFGLLLHFLIMSLIVAVFYAASRGLPVLTRQWMIYGVAYGVAVYFVMNFIVLPLSAFPGGLPSLAAIVQGVLVHVLCVGLPIAFITRHFSQAAHLAGE